MNHARMKQLTRPALRIWAADQPNDPLAARAGLRDCIVELTELGQIAVSIRSMDCDCHVWTRCHVMPATVMNVVALINEIYEHAEGPVQWSLIRPSQRHGSQHEDLAAAAWENGHAHSVMF